MMHHYIMFVLKKEEFMVPKLHLSIYKYQLPIAIHSYAKLHRNLDNG